VAKGGRILEARRSSSRERRVFEEGCAISFVLRHGRDARRRLPAEGTLDRQSARLSRGPRRTGLGDLRTVVRIRRKANPGDDTEEATGVPEAVVIRFHAAEENAAA